MSAPKGHIRQRGGSYEISVPIGRDPVTKRYRYIYDHAGSQEEAERKRAVLIKRVTEGREPMNRATVSELLDRWLSVAELEVSTRVSYQGYIERVIRPVLGKRRLRELEVQVDILDVLYAELHRCRKLCGGRKGLVDHRPLGRARRAGEDGPGHECDERCGPHQCRPLEPSSISQIHSILRRAFNFGVKWRWMSENPARLATIPKNSADLVDPPTPQEATRLLEAAEAHSPDLAVFVWLVMITGARRGEMCALRWTDVDLAEQDVLIERAYAVRQGTKMIKDTKTHQKRRLAIDTGTLDMLAEHLERCRERAELAGGALSEDGYVFSRDGFGELPWIPDTVGHWFRDVAEAAGVDATIKSLRHYNATQMLTGGIDLRTAAARLGHGGGGHMTLRVYAHRTRPSDQRAAEVLARGLRGGDHDD